MEQKVIPIASWPPTALANEVRRLQDENETLKERIRLLEGSMDGVEYVFPLEWKITAMERRFLIALIAHGRVNRDRLMTIIYNGNVRSEKSIDVHAYKLRKKLGKVGMKIYTAYREGYFIDKATRERLQGYKVLK